MSVFRLLQKLGMYIENKPIFYNKFKIIENGSEIQLVTGNQGCLTCEYIKHLIINKKIVIDCSNVTEVNGFIIYLNRESNTVINGYVMDGRKWDGIAITFSDTESKMKYVSNTWSELLGFSREEVIDKDVFDTVEKSSLKKIEFTRHNIARSQKPDYVRFQVKNKIGHTIDLLSLVIPIIDNDKFVFMLAITQKVDNRTNQVSV